MKVRLLSPAIDEIADAAVWFDSQRAELGSEFWHAVDTLLNRIEANPFAFARSEFATSQYDLRCALVRRFQYVVHYLIEADEVQIVSVSHAARRPGYWLRRVKK